jgi:antitoxin (DNA-binding transcriptional repressor) of toxin-antitoxin stability system
MHSMNIRQLRETRRLKSLLRAGKTVELRDRDRVIAHIVPEKQEEKPVKWPDFAARRKKIFGDRILPGADIVIEERGRY